MKMKLRWVCTPALVGWFIFVTGSIFHEGYLKRLQEPAPTTERCIAAEVWSRLCYDRNWRKNWVPTCDLCLPGMEKPPTQTQYEYDCRLDVIRESCVSQVAILGQGHRDERIIGVVFFAVAYLGIPSLFILPYLCWKVLAGRMGKSAPRRQAPIVERAPR